MNVVIFFRELYRHLNPENVVYEPVRVMVANRLSQFGSQWARYFEKHNSGTYNNMWMVVDYKKLDEEEIPTESVLTVLEQLPHMVVIHDETKTLLTQVRIQSVCILRAKIPTFYLGILEILQSGVLSGNLPIIRTTRKK